MSALLSPILPSIYRWAIYAALGTAILATVAGKAYLAGDDHGQGVVRAQDAKAQAAVYSAFEANLKDAHRLGGLLTAANHIALTYYGQLGQETAHDTHPTVAAPGAATAVPVLTARAVCLWDRAWAGDDVPGGFAGSRDDGGTACAGPDAEGASGFDVRDALWSDVNAAQVCWADIRELRSLQQWERDRAARAPKH